MIMLGMSQHQNTMAVNKRKLQTLLASWDVGATDGSSGDTGVWRGTVLWEVCWMGSRKKEHRGCYE